MYTIHKKNLYQTKGEFRLNIIGKGVSISCVSFHTLQYYFLFLLNVLLLLFLLLLFQLSPGRGLMLSAVITRNSLNLGLMTLMSSSLGMTSSVFSSLSSSLTLGFADGGGGFLGAMMGI